MPTRLRARRHRSGLWVAQAAPPPAGPTTFVSDSFTDVNGTALEAHTPETGGAITKHAGGGTGTTAINNNRVWSSTGSTALHFYAAVPPSADYVVKITWANLTDNNASTNGGGGRIDTTANTGYFVRASAVNNNLEIFRLLAGVFLSLGTAAGLPANGTVSELRMAGDQISLVHDGAQVIAPVTDTGIAAAGRAGVRTGGAQTSTTGIQLDALEAATL
jgi:hypothetical protein